MSFSFDATQVAPDQGALGPVPEGWYKVTIESTEIKPTKAGTGLILNIVFNVAEGSFLNRKIYGRYNIDNPNSQAVEIARGQLSAICHATGLMQFQDPNQLKGGPLQLRVAVKQSEGYDPQNEIKAYKSMTEVIDGEFPGITSGAASGFTAPAAPNAGGAPSGPGGMQPSAGQAGQAEAYAGQAANAGQPWQDGQPAQQQAAPAQQAQQQAPVQQTATQQAPVQQATQQAAGTDTPPWMQ